MTELRSSELLVMRPGSFPRKLLSVKGGLAGGTWQPRPGRGAGAIS